MVRGARGEFVLQAGERKVQILFTNRALASAEKAMDKPILGVLQNFGQGSVQDLALMLQAGMEAARRDARESGRVITLNEAYEVMDEAGFSATAAAVFSAIGEVLSYGQEDQDPNP